MSDKDKGMYGKFIISRTDKQDIEESDKHFECEYFVLDLTHDRHAISALQAYINSCEREYPLLATDLRLMLTRSIEGVR